MTGVVAGRDKTDLHVNYFEGQKKEKNKLVWYGNGVCEQVISMTTKGSKLIFEQAGLAWLDKGLYNKLT